MINLLPLLVVICFAGVVFCAMMIFRNNLIYDIRIKAIAMASTSSKNIPYNSKVSWRECYELLKEYQNYEQMMWSLTKWNFEDFYPMLEERLLWIENGKPVS